MYPVDVTLLVAFISILVFRVAFGMIIFMYCDMARDRIPLILDITLLYIIAFFSLLMFVAVNREYLFRGPYFFQVEHTHNHVFMDAHNLPRE